MRIKNFELGRLDPSSASHEELAQGARDALAVGRVRASHDTSHTIARASAYATLALYELLKEQAETQGRLDDMPPPTLT